jgi:hypothetical protein
MLMLRSGPYGELLNMTAHPEEPLSLSKRRLEGPLRASRQVFAFAQPFLRMSGFGGVAQ